MLQEFKITIRNNENIGQMTPETVSKITEIFTALISSGGLTGVKGGKTILHFDGNGEFMAVQLDYMPWRRRKGN